MEAVDLRLVGIITAVAWTLANAPLWAAIYRHRGSPSDLWITVTASPNRYLFSLLFLPCIYFATFLIWGLAGRCISGMSPQKHPVLSLLSSPPALILSSLAICSIVALWDYAAGNYNNADLYPPYGVAALKARDIVLDADCTTLPSSAPSPERDVSDLETTARNISAGTVSDAASARVFLRKVAAQRTRLVDPVMVHCNLVNVWFFALAIWLPFWNLIVLALARQAEAIHDSSSFDMCKYPILFCILCIAVWGSLRSYELHEFKEAMGIESREVVDLFLAAMVLIVLCILTAWAFDLSAIELAGAALVPLSFMIGSQFFTSLLRSSCGSGMSIANFAIVVLLWCMSCGALLVVFLGGKL